MPSQRNVNLVEQLKERLSRSTIVIATGFTGLNAATMTELRRKLRESGLEYRVVKNTLATIAAQQAGKPQVAQIITGSTGLVLGYGESVQTAKVLLDYLRTSRIALTVQGAVADGQVLDAQALGTLATLPPKPELVAKLAGQLMGLVAALAGAMSSPTGQLAYLLNAPGRGMATVLQRHAEGQGAGAS